MALLSILMPNDMLPKRKLLIESNTLTLIQDSAPLTERGSCQSIFSFFSFFPTSFLSLLLAVFLRLPTDPLLPWADEQEALRGSILRF